MITIPATDDPAPRCGDPRLYPKQAAALKRGGARDASEKLHALFDRLINDYRRSKNNRRKELRSIVRKKTTSRRQSADPRSLADDLVDLAAPRYAARFRRSGDRRAYRGLLGIMSITDAYPDIRDAMVFLGDLDRIAEQHGLDPAAFRNPMAKISSPLPYYRGWPSTRDILWVDREPVLRALATGDLEGMIKGLAATCSPLTRTRLRCRIIEACYKKRREDPERVEQAAKMMRSLLLSVSQYPIRSSNDQRQAAFKQLIIMLADSGDLNRATRLCQHALRLGLDDGTRGGYRARHKRLLRRSLR